ncbi:M4 family metallopeptidase [Pseudomonas syringae]|nr:M4 family metallopeptidase [Pseudomonas syringae]
MCTHNPLHCFIPPYMLEHMSESRNPKVRYCAIANLACRSAFVATRLTTQSMLVQSMPGTTPGHKQREVYDARDSAELPGRLARSEDQPLSGDAAVDEAYEGSGLVYDFYEQLFERRSLDDNGMALVSSVHVTEVDMQGDRVPLNNAFWNGRQMAYGDGDGEVFRRFTASLEVIGHELTHGVQSFTSQLVYQGQSGALNEHFADVFGMLVRQWHERTPVNQANWLVGQQLLVPAPTRRGIRDMLHPGTAYSADPELGDDPQPAHMADLYTGQRDRGGVHINSGIPNRAFALFAQALGGNAWEVAGRIWYETLLQLPANSQFSDCARISAKLAGQRRYGAGARRAVTAAWREVGIRL